MTVECSTACIPDHDTEVVAVAPGECESIAGNRLGPYALLVTGDQCQLATGANITGSDEIECEFDICSVKGVTRGGMFVAAPGSCGTDKKADISLR